MKTKIVGFGDSFVFGSELADNNNGQLSWVGQAAKQLGVEYETTAIPCPIQGYIHLKMLTKPLVNYG